MYRKTNTISLEQDNWIFSWWALLDYHDWRTYDSERPTENQAFQNISEQCYVASVVRAKNGKAK